MDSAKDSPARREETCSTFVSTPRESRQARIHMARGDEFGGVGMPALDMDVSEAVRTVEDEVYWKARAEAQTPRWLACDPAAHGGSWKALFAERHCAEQVALAGTVPESSGRVAELRWALACCAPCIRALTLKPSASAPALHLEHVFEALFRSGQTSSFARFSFSFIPLR